MSEALRGNYTGTGRTGAVCHAGSSAAVMSSNLQAGLIYITVTVDNAALFIWRTSQTFIQLNAAASGSIADV